MRKLKLKSQKEWVAWLAYIRIAVARAIARKLKSRVRTIENRFSNRFELLRIRFFICTQATRNYNMPGLGKILMWCIVPAALSYLLYRRIYFVSSFTFHEAASPHLLVHHSLVATTRTPPLPSHTLIPYSVTMLSRPYL